MKTNFIFPFLLTILICQQACKPKERLMGVQIMAQNKPVPNANVITNVKDIYGVTDSDGNIFFEASKDSIKKISRLTVFKRISEDIYIDTTYNKNFTSIKLPKNPKKIDKKRSMSVNRININTKSRKGTSPDSIVDKYDDILSFMDQLNYTDSLLAKLEREVMAYMKKYPNSAMKDLLPLINIRREDLKKLTLKFEQLETTFQSAIVKAGNGDLSDAEFAEMQQNFSESEQLFDLYMKKVAELVVVGDRSIEARPELEKLKTDFYYELGKYKIKNLAGNLDKNLSMFVQDINQYIQEQIDQGQNDLELHIIVVGYTDGLAVNESLYKEFATVCQQYDEHSGHRDGNDCLSKLRAENMAEYLCNSFTHHNFICVTNTKAYGSANAVAGVSDPDKRRCDASVLIFPRDLKKSIIQK
jgi:outer membrane protein OmpA-like peptidoglycan-associated protein